MLFDPEIALLEVSSATKSLLFAVVICRVLNVSLHDNYQRYQIRLLNWNTDPLIPILKELYKQVAAFSTPDSM